MTTNYDKDKPAGSQKIRLSDEEIRANWTALEDAIGRNHNFPGNENSDAGEHKVVELQDQSGDATVPANVIGIYNDGNVLKARLASDGRIIRLETEVVTLAKTSAYTAVLADFGKVLLVTNTTTIDLAAAATLGDGWHIFIKNNGSGVVTVDPNSSETIDGSATLTITSADDCFHIVCDGSNFHVLSDHILLVNPHAHTDNASGGELTGMAVQVVNTIVTAVDTGTTVMVKDDTIPQNSEGDEYMSLSITPKDATNKLKIDIVIFLASGDVQTFIAALFQDSTVTALAVGAQHHSSNNVLIPINFTYYMTAGTTSATTFKVRAGVDKAGTTTFNGLSSSRLFGGTLASSITITEIQN